MTATVPEGWSGIRGSTFANLFQLNDDLPTGAIGAWRCRTASSSTPVSPGMMDPPLGPTVDDFVTALAEVPGYTTTEPTDVDLFSGTPAPTSRRSDSLRSPSPPTASRTPGTPSYDETAPYDSNDQHHRLWVLDVDGVRVVVDLVGANALPHPTGTDP
jgi:hypothetical protein